MEVYCAASVYKVHMHIILFKYHSNSGRQTGSIVHTKKLRLRVVKQQIQVAHSVYSTPVRRESQDANPGLCDAEVYVLPNTSKKGKQKEA